MHCFHFDPWKSRFIGLSITHTTRPVKKIKIIVAIHRSFASGCRKIHVVGSSSLLDRTSIETPDSVYGIVKSTYLVRLAIIVTSPTAASNFSHLVKDLGY
ncbi:Os06g0190850 [Oryza sativa Japonica Group]|uniref:Os06g0190850 protein n=1 Tax=Oryza sativa subsp. japonica TaxID=39947 RepID=A0A0P0WTX2_ORYSJ|nr:hypothetical protein EE612_032402 [Oryza sativa]BAS96564.1 Os06g0190850 [Oryza sativa Japonica Group]